ncbi:unnamed protein product [Fraxinus pennsylvanica]|uniref:Uncharacterized protein n=1 Tax=Fraxinus pennsylvanica TaxID=56036 RepID=A0AAD2DZF1_9LAMI|nr:unnamed protein product [Fraxinus pennsylvanica]
MYLCKSNPSFFYKSHFSLSFSLLFSSSSTEKKVKNDLTVYDFLLHKHQFSPETASQVASVLTRIKNPEKSDSILSFLKESGFSKSQLERVVKTKPGLLGASLEKTIKPKFKIFQDLGFSAEDIAEIISNDPANLHRSADSRVRPSLAVLKRLLGSSAENRVTAKHGCNLHFGLHLFFNLSFLMKDEMDSLGSATNSGPNK